MQVINFDKGSKKKLQKIHILESPVYVRTDTPAVGAEGSVNVTVDGRDVAGVSGNVEVGVNTTSDPSQVIDVSGKIEGHVGPLGGTLVEGQATVGIKHDFMDGPNTNIARAKACLKNDECSN